MLIKIVEAVAVAEFSFFSTDDDGDGAVLLMVGLDV